MRVASCLAKVPYDATSTCPPCESSTTLMAMRFVFILCGLAACGSDAKNRVVEGVRDPSAIDACARGDVGKQLAIVSDLRDSYHEMIVCGGLALDFNTAVVNVVVN